MQASPAHTPKAIALLSGGLDSALAAKLVKDCGVEVVGLHLLSPFGCRERVDLVAERLGISLMVRDKGEAYLDLVKNPKYGYGRHMNPCIDCRIYMFHIAESVREEIGADFILTGEVLGQRPMSQIKSAIRTIDRESEMEDRVLRPLCAQLFPETLPERMGWTPRERLFRMNGRSRKPQIELAKQLGIEGYSSPGGGCLLTEAGFSSKLREFYAHDNGAQDSETRMAHAGLLSTGRHFRLSPTLKVILGRNESDNQVLDQAMSHGVIFHPVGFEGPSAIALGSVDEEQRTTIGALIAHYGKGESKNQVSYKSTHENGTITVQRGLSDEELTKLRV